MRSLKEMYEGFLADNRKHLAESQESLARLTATRDQFLTEASAVLTQEELQLLDKWSNSNQACFSEGLDQLRSELALFYGFEFHACTPEIKAKWTIIVNAAFSISHFWCQIAQQQRRVIDCEKQVREYQEKVDKA